MFEPCRGCDTADVFLFDAYIEGPPWGPRMSLYKDPNGVLHYHVLSTRVAALLFVVGSAVCLLRVRGREIPSALGFREGMGDSGRALAPDASRR